MSEKKPAITTMVAKVNNVEIVVVENGTKLVPIKPICEALGISFEPQFTRLKSDPNLSSTITLSVTVAADGKSREMACIPLKYVFGWLFQIDSRNVKEDAREAVQRYQKICYDVLYDHFDRQTEFLKQRQLAVDVSITEYDEARRSFKDAEKIMQAARQKLDKVRAITFQEWFADHSQLSMFSKEEMEG